jgi:hypothetical protein
MGLGAIGTSLYGYQAVITAESTCRPRLATKPTSKHRLRRIPMLVWHAFPQTTQHDPTILVAIYPRCQWLTALRPAGSKPCDYLDDFETAIDGFFLRRHQGLWRRRTGNLSPRDSLPAAPTRRTGSSLLPSPIPTSAGSARPNCTSGSHRSSDSHSGRSSATRHSTASARWPHCNSQNSPQPADSPTPGFHPCSSAARLRRTHMSDFPVAASPLSPVCRQ